MKTGNRPAEGLPAIEEAVFAGVPTERCQGSVAALPPTSTC